MIDLLGKVLETTSGKSAFGRYLRGRYNFDLENVLINETSYKAHRFEQPYSYLVLGRDRDGSRRMVFANDGTVRFGASGNVLSSDFVDFLDKTLTMQGAPAGSVYKALVKNTEEVAQIQKDLIDKDRDRNIHNIQTYLGREETSSKN